jgi:hypothetical protein
MASVEYKGPICLVLRCIDSEAQTYERIGLIVSPVHWNRGEWRRLRGIGKIRNLRVIGKNGGGESDHDNIKRWTEK